MMRSYEHPMHCITLIYKYEEEYLRTLYCTVLHCIQCVIVFYLHFTLAFIYYHFSSTENLDAVACVTQCRTSIYYRRATTDTRIMFIIILFDSLSYSSYLFLSSTVALKEKCENNQWGGLVLIIKITIHFRPICMSSEKIRENKYEVA